MSPETSRRGLQIKDETHDEMFSFTDGTHMLFVVLYEYIPDNGRTQSPRKQGKHTEACLRTQINALKPLFSWRSLG